jgi:hypothetical protein
MLTVWNGQVCVAGELPHPDGRYKLIAYWPTGITSQQWQATRNSGALNQPLNGDGNGCYTERTTGVQVRLADGDATTVVHASVVENPASRLAGSDRIDAVIAPMNRGTTSPLPERVPRVSPQAATKGNSE